MSKNFYFLFILSLTMIASLGCSLGAPSTPSLLDTHDDKSPESSASNRMLWGMWQFQFNESTGEMIAEPLRVAFIHFNGTAIVLPPNCTDCVKVNINSFDPITRILDADVTLRNPVLYIGHDVRGILYTNDFGHALLNADDWTGLFDIPGGDTINPFKAFAKSVGKRVFGPALEYTENYILHIPTPPSWNKITYAVDASWPGNCKEPYSIENFTQAEISSDVGSHGIVNVDVKDWQGDVSEVKLEASDITGEPSTSLIFQTGDTWSVDLINNTGVAVGDYPVKIIATSSGSGTTALYDFSLISISEPVSGGWAKTWGGNDADWGYSVAVDGSGNAYVAGSFKSISLDFNPDPTAVDPHSSNGYEDIFLCKFDPSGTFVWARTWGGSYWDVARGVAVDGSGNVYVTGYFTDMVDFDPDPTAFDSHLSHGTYDTFLSKFDPSGSFVWARTWGGVGDDLGIGVAVDGLGNVHVTGYFSGNSAADFNPDPTSEDFHSSNGGYDSYLSKFDPSGTFVWARTWGGTVHEYGWGVAVDGSGEAYVTGWFKGSSVDFNPDPTAEDFHSSNGDYTDIFLSKFDPSGSFLWARSWGGSVDDFGFGVAVDGSGDAYVTGYFSGTSVDFNPDPTGEDFHSSNGSTDTFLSKFDPSGTFEWARTWGGSDFYGDNGYSVAVDGSGDVYVTGYFTGLVDFNPDPTSEDLHSVEGYSDIFLSKFDSSGTFVWARTWGGSSEEWSWGVAVDISGNVYVAGVFAGTYVDFNPDPSVWDQHSSNGLWDVFLSKFKSDGSW